MKVLFWIGFERKWFGLGFWNTTEIQPGRDDWSWASDEGLGGGSRALEQDEVHFLHLLE